MKHLYLMRHGETLFNLRRKIQGWCDSPLTEAGIEQAKQAGAMLAARGITFSAAYSSTAERACDTLEFALEAAGQPLPYTRVKGLRERGFGTFESESEDLNPPTPELYDEFFPIYGGETRAEVCARTVAALTEIMERDESTQVLACSHAGAIMCFTSHLGNPMEIIGGPVSNGCVLHFGYEDGAFRFIEALRA